MGHWVISIKVNYFITVLNYGPQCLIANLLGISTWTLALLVSTTACVNANTLYADQIMVWWIAKNSINRLDVLWSVTIREEFEISTLMLSSSNDMKQWLYCPRSFWFIPYFYRLIIVNNHEISRASQIAGAECIKINYNITHELPKLTWDMQKRNEIFKAA